MTTGDEDELFVAKLSAHALSLTGYRADDAVLLAIRRALHAERAKGVSLARLCERAMDADPEITDLLVTAVSVPETYFFRQPEHFELIESRVLPKLGDRPRICAWSAGCATGEETYSLAACLLACAKEGTAVEVLGTDSSAKNIAKATSGTFSPWSLRAPLLYPLLEPTGEERKAISPTALENVKVANRVRAVTRCLTHSVLSPPPRQDGFDLILCRNVLLYLSSAAIDVALAQLARALSPGGFILFGALDIDRIPGELVRAGPAETNMFMKPTMPTWRPAARKDAPVDAFAKSSPGSETIAVHERALELIDAGDRPGAEQVLERLLGRSPTYLPGLLEYALLQQHAGRESRAIELMGELLECIEVLPEGARVAGPLDLSVDYYRLAAEAFLKSKARRQPQKESLR
jgi:chemotaxis protein methyltransferase CheR